MKGMSRPVITSLLGRYSSTQAATKSHFERSNLPKKEPKVTRMATGLVVASLENYSPVSHLSIVYNAGSRHENPEEIGIVHCLRNASGLSTQRASLIGLVRTIQQIGGSLSCSSNREYISYNLECTRNHLDTGFEMLTHSATCPLFNHWELSDALPRLRYDVQYFKSNPELQLFEALHKAAYRDTLGQSLYMPEHRIGSHSSDMLKQYVSNHFTAENMAVVGLGVDHDHLLRICKKITSPTRNTETKKATYKGGEVRIETSNSTVQAVIGSQGAPISSKDALTLALLQRILGTGPYVKYGKDLAGAKLTKAVAKATTLPFAVSCINATYSDSGLFGIHVIANEKAVGNVIRTVIAQVKNVGEGDITENDLKKAKAQLEAYYVMQLETQSAQLDALTQNVIVSGSATSKALDLNAIKVADVQAAAKKLWSNKATLAAVGNLGYTPYLDELL